MHFPMISLKQITSICPIVDEGQHIFAEGLVLSSVIFVTVVDQRTHKMCIVKRFETLLRDHVFQPSETTPDTPTDVLPENGCILMK